MPLIYILGGLAIVFAPAWLFYLIVAVAVIATFIVASGVSPSLGAEAAAIVAVYGIILWVVRFAIQHLHWV